MNKLPKDDWITVRLDDIAQEISDKVENPAASPPERFVGLEHLDSGDFTVRIWGSTRDVTSSMKHFKKGDVLLARRNAYLRRASRADFEGVCSGDAYVIRERPHTIAEGLLPVILNSDSFWNYAIAHASGTMSKRAKWRDLKEYTFALPPREAQQRASSILWAAEECITQKEQLVEVAILAKRAYGP